MHLEILGSINLDIISELETLPRPGDTVLARRTTEGFGGKGANQARAAARFGAKVFMHAAVGADEAGRRLVAGLQAEGVDVTGIAMRHDAPTGKAYVMVAADGENMIVVDAGANRQARFAARSSLKAPAVLLAQFEAPVAAAAAMFEAARPGDLRLLNAAPPVLEGRSALPLADVLILNAHELGVYGGSDGGGDPETLARSLITRPEQTVVITLGAAGVLIVNHAGVERLDGLKVEVVDTTGAGDCFVGVLAAALAEGLPLRTAAGLGNQAAALSVQSLGADSAPTRYALSKALAPSASYPNPPRGRQDL
jgi:ribokinase